MSPTRYEELLGLVAPLRIKLNQRRESIGPRERLCVTLRYLVIRETLKSPYPLVFLEALLALVALLKTSEVLWDVLAQKGYINCIDNEEE